MTLQTQPIRTDATAEDSTEAAARLVAIVETVTIYLPGDAGYDEARTLWNTAVDLRPAAIAEPSSAAEVSAVVAASQHLGLRVAPVSTGHNAGPLVQHDLDATVLVKLSAMTTVEVDPMTASAKVQGGALWGDVIDAAGRHGLACLHGSSPDVGVGGYLLGGGIFLYGRRLGMATNSLRAVEIVLADGSLIRADHHQHPSLFWALRGGGGNFGIVTSFEFSLYPLETVHAGMMVWDIADADWVVRAWADWAQGAPDEITTSMRILNLPQGPGIPESVGGRRVVCMDGAVLGGEAQADSILAPLRALSPQVDTFDQVSPTALAQLHMDPLGPTPVTGDTALLGHLNDEAIGAFLAEVGPGTEHTLLSAELRQLGGALARRDPDGGALNRLDGNFLLFGVAVADTAENEARGHADASDLVRAMSPWSTGRRYLNFAEEPVDVGENYGEREWLTLTRVKSAYDPENLFAANHPVPRVHT